MLSGRRSASRPHHPADVAGGKRPDYRAHSEENLTVPLSHIKVVDLCRARAGPTCVRQLAEYGAQIIKVEAPETEEDGTGDRHSFDFQNIHPNKRSITLNLKSDEGRAILLKLVEQADVVVENYRPDVKHRLGIDYETLSKINPRLVYASISGFGQRSPRASPAS
jgi:formyl-CoA transferase